MESVRRLPAALKVAVLAGAALALVVVGRSTDTGMPPIKHTAVSNTGGTFFPITPTRILDTRVSRNTLASQTPLKLQVTSASGPVPSGAGSVVLNVTAVMPQGDGYIEVWPDGVAQPTSSNLNFRAGEIVPNMVMVALPTSGSLDIYSNVGVDVVVDVAGYFAPGSTATTSGV